MVFNKVLVFLISMNVIVSILLVEEVNFKFVWRVVMDIGDFVFLSGSVDLNLV